MRLLWPSRRTAGRSMRLDTLQGSLRGIPMAHWRGGPGKPPRVQRRGGGARGAAQAYGPQHVVHSILSNVLGFLFKKDHSRARHYSTILAHGNFRNDALTLLTLAPPRPRLALPPGDAIPPEARNRLFFDVTPG